MEVELDQDLPNTAIQSQGPSAQEALGSGLGEVGDLAGLSSISLPAYANGHSITNDLDTQEQCEDFEINSSTVMPPLEVFGHTNPDTKLKHFLSELSEGEILITSISSKTVHGLILKVLCTYTEPIRCVSDINVRGFCQEYIPDLSIGDNLCCEVLEVIPEACKIVCGIKGDKCPKEYKDALGLFNMENCPQTFKLFHAGKNDESYNSMLQNSTGFKNPSNTLNLELITGVSDNKFSIIPALLRSFPENKIEIELSKVQSAELAIQSVLVGIKYFKTGLHSEALLLLNEALSIDSLNVEAYVARGALYANTSRFPEAIEDLKFALKINAEHVNGRKYLSETLMGYARTLESQNKLEEALQYYEECLDVIPDHDEAKASIEYLKSTLVVGRSIPMNTLGSLPEKINVTDLEKSAISDNSNSSSTDSTNSGSSSDIKVISFSRGFSDIVSDVISSSNSSGDGFSGNDLQKVEKERSFEASIEYLKSTLAVERSIPMNTLGSLPKKINITDLEKSGSSSDVKVISSSDTVFNVSSLSDSSSDGLSSANNKQRSRTRSVSKRRINYSRSTSSGGRSSKLPFKKKPKETLKSKTRSRYGSYPRHQRYSSSSSNSSRSSLRSYSRSRSRSMHHRNRMPYYNNCNRGTYFKPHFQNQNRHNRGFQNRGFQHRRGYVHRQHYNNYNNNWNNRGQRGGGRQRFFHYRPRQYDRNKHYERRSSSNRHSCSHYKSRIGSKNSKKEYRKSYSSSSGEDQQHIANNKPKTPPEPTTETNKRQLDSNDNGNRNSQDRDEGSIK